MDKSSKLIIYVIKSNVEKCKTAYQFSKTSVFIGRWNPQNHEQKLDLMFKGDMSVSRKHAFVFFKDGKYFVKDLGSKRGTIVNGIPIKVGEPFELDPGTPVLTGKMLWTIIPSNWLYLDFQDVLLTAPFSKTINYALCHCGQSVIGDFNIKNYGNKISKPVSLEITIPEYISSCKVDIPAIASDESITIDAPSLEFNISELRRQIEPVQANLYIRIDKENIKNIYNLNILGFKAWSYEEYAFKTIASFVSPHDSFIENIVSKAESLVKRISGCSSFSELMYSDRDDTEKIILQIIYEYLKDSGNIDYIYPEAQSLNEEKEKYQIIKSPGAIFNNDPKSLAGKATCIDLAIFMASFLENIGILPLVFLIDNEESTLKKEYNMFVPTHAFVGCWAGTIPGNQPIIDDVTFLQNEIKEQNLFVVECTGFATGININGNLDFDKAEQAAISQLNDNCQVRVVDVGALRPPNGSITPMEYSFEPEVVKIFQSAKLFAKHKKRKIIETIHLFYGILSSKGEVITWLFNNYEKNIPDILDALDKLEKEQHSTNDPVPSKNFTLCKQLAEWYCQKSGVSSVREQDIIWALLDNGQKSEHFKKICRKLDLDTNELCMRLNKECPRPFLSLETSHSSY